MASPQPRADKARRRQRSTRLTVAVVLLVLAALAVLGAVLSGSWLLVTLAARPGGLLGAAPTPTPPPELARPRRDAARDRAEQARAYRDLTDVRSAEHAEFA